MSFISDSESDDGSTVGLHRIREFCKEHNDGSCWLIADHNRVILERVLENDDKLKELLIGSPFLYEGEFTYPYDTVCANSSEYSQFGAAIGTNTHITKLTIKTHRLLELDSSDRKDFLDGLKRNSSIKQLEIYDEGFKIKSFVRKVLKVYEENTILTHLHINKDLRPNCNGIGYAGCKAIATLLSNPNCNLHGLTLFDCNIDDKGANTLANGLGNKTKLQELNLHGNRIGNSGCEAIAFLLGEPNCNLQELSLSQNNINAEGANILANGLVNNDKLQMLILDGNRIGNAGCEAIATLLGNPNCNLQYLSLLDTNIDDKGAITLANGLVNNNKLQELDLCENPINNIDNAVVEAFSRVLCNKRSISCTFLSNHTLKKLRTYSSSGVKCSELHYLLKLNGCQDKSHVAIKKILKYHPNIDMEQFFEFGTEDESLKALPYVVDWFEKARVAAADEEDPKEGCNISQQKLSAIFQFARFMPLLFVPSPTDMLQIRIDAQKRHMDKLEREVNALKIDNGLLREQVELLTGKRSWRKRLLGWSKPKRSRKMT